MKKSLLFIILFSSSLQSLLAQDWFSEDDHWVFRNYAWSSEGYSDVKITGDTMINNVLCKKMFFDSKNVTYQYGDSINNAYDEIVYEINDSVFYQNEFDAFELIYDFTMQTGDTLTLYGLWNGEECTVPSYYILDSLSTMIMGLDTFDIQYLTVVDTYWDYTYQIEVIETIGCTTGSFFRQRNHFCGFDNPGYELCSFTNENNDYQFKEEDCYDLPVSLDPEIISDPIAIYPNPTEDYIHIDMEQTPDLLEFYNLQGQKMSSYTGTKDVNVSAFSQGIYLLKISRDHKHIIKKITVK